MSVFIPSPAKTNAPPSRHLKVQSLPGQRPPLGTSDTALFVPPLVIGDHGNIDTPDRRVGRATSFLASQRKVVIDGTRHLLSLGGAIGSKEGDCTRHSAGTIPMSVSIFLLSTGGDPSTAPEGLCLFSQSANSRRSYYFWTANMLAMGSPFCADVAAPDLQLEAEPLIFPLELSNTFIHDASLTQYLVNSVIEEVKTTFDGRRRKIGHGNAGTGEPPRRSKVFKIRDDRRQVAILAGVKYTYTAKVSKSPQREHILDHNPIRGKSSLIAAGLWSDSLSGTLIRGKILFLFESLKYSMKQK
ncbi:hypothetical protein DFS33DRAFT_1274059 [Desarmillaria ectypa]|nr:hypothetical protein DFS33DRAFT_1274059 [Desarmillaria ectypa]